MEHAALVQAFAEHLAVARGASPHTVAAYRRDTGQFAAFLAETGVAVADAGRDEIEGWLAGLAKSGSVGARSSARKLTAVRQFYAFLMERGWAGSDPTELVPLPKMPQTLPKALSVDDIKKLLASPLGNSPSEVRLRVMLQLLYATGLRVSELCGLTLDAVAEGEGLTLRVTGKGSKTRLVPVGEVASATLQAYLKEARPRLKGSHGPWVFAGPSGKRALTRVRVFQLLKEAGARVGVEVAPHHLRHTFATHLLQNDADLRAVQLMLGHSSLNTTQIYTKVAQQRLKDTLDKHHPLMTGGLRK